MDAGQILSTSWKLLVCPAERAWFNGCRDLLKRGEIDQLKKLDDKIGNLFRLEDPAVPDLTKFFQDSARFHVACAKAIHQANRFAAEASQKTLESIAPAAGSPLKIPDDLAPLVSPRFSLGEARALIRELAGHHHEKVLAHSVTPALLVPGNGGDGVVMDLHLELIEEPAGGGHLYAAPEMLFVHRRPKQNGERRSFDDAMAHAVQWVDERGFWPTHADVRWRLRRQYADDPWFDEVSGDSAGGAFLFGLLQLLAQAGRVPADAVYDPVRALNRHPHSLRGVVWMCTVNEEGLLSPIGMEPQKFRGLRNRSRPAIHTVVAAPAQMADVEAALNPENAVDGIRYFPENDPLEAARLVVAELDGTWRDIFDYRQDWEAHRKAMARPWLDEQFEAYRLDRLTNPEQTPGWLLLDAHARFGKSAFAARIFGPEAAGVAGHFFRADGGRDDAALAIRSILLQLCLIHRLEAPDLGKTPLKTAADRIFGRAAESSKARGELQIVVLDGLDRCADFTALETLLPEAPPPGLAFVATTHPWMPLGKLGNPGRARMVALPDRGALAAEVQEYLKIRRREFEPALEDGLIGLLVERSHGLIGVARDLLAHGQFSKWREDPARDIPDGPGAWQGRIWAEGSDWQKIENYRRRLIGATGEVDLLAAKEDRPNENRKFPIAKAYVPMTTAPPVNRSAKEGSRSAPEPVEVERPAVLFQRMFEHLAATFPDERRNAILLEGEAGSGKTTASKKLASEAARFDPIAGLPAGILPVWLRFQEMREDAVSLDAFLIDRVDRDDAGDASGSEGTGRALLDCRQPILWIFDGFDEIATSGRQSKVAGWIERLAADVRRKEKGDRILVTSRSLDAGPNGSMQLADLSRFNLSPLDDDAQREFVDQYLQLLDPGSTPRTDDLMGIVAAGERHSGEDRRMARNPMLLSLICYLFSEGDLPPDWDDLHDKFVNRLLLRGIQILERQADAGAPWRPQKALTPVVSKDLLCHLAWWMQGQDDRVSQLVDNTGTVSGTPCLADQVDECAKANRWNEDQRAAIPSSPIKCLHMMHEQMGVMCGRGAGPGRLGFLHLNIQEYLAACHAAKSGLGAELAQRFGRNPDAQREVVRLAVRRRERDQVAANFHHDLFLGLLSPEVAADEKHDVFLSRLLETAGVAG